MPYPCIDSAISSLLPLLSPHHIIFLEGDLASGKTTLVQKLAQRIGVCQNVTSPTFGIQHAYISPTHTLFHYDLYRKNLKECLELGLLEMLDIQGWHFIEWGDETLENILKQSGFAMIRVSITKVDSNRTYRIFQK